MMKDILYKKHLLVSCLLAAIIIMICGCTSNDNNEETTSESTTKNILDINMGKTPVEPVYMCDAEKLSKLQIDYTPFVDLNDKLENQSFINECKANYSMWAEQTNTALYGSKGFYLSSTPVYAYNLNDEKLAKVMSCYIFTEDRTVAGEIQFSLNGGEITPNFTIARANSVNRIMRTMKESPDKKFIKIFNNREHTIIDEDSKPLDIDFKMTGDVFHTLNYEFLGVSYNDIIENLVWIQFD